MTTVLAIETSCDETAAAVVRDGRELLSSVVSSQIALHQPSGGVVPEIAARAHLEQLPTVVAQALEVLPGGLDDIDGIAVTRGPGLIGCLLVGTSYAQALAAARDLPIVGVSHLAGHVYSAWLADVTLEPPFCALVVSGGHSECVVIEAHGRAREISATRDDAAGEAYDKAARLMGLPYPGGPVIDALAKEGDMSRFRLPITRLEDGLSFSGLKTAVRYLIRDLPSGSFDDQGQLAPQLARDIAASFQHAVITQLGEALERAIDASGAPAVALVGGVAANSGLRAEVKRRCEGLQVAIPPMALCTDNAAMIGAAGWNRVAVHGWDAHAFDADPSVREFA